MATTEIREHWTARHRGPYRFHVSRTTAKPGKTTSEWVKGASTADDVEAEALALLADPRDTIYLVCVWSQRDQQFVFSYKGARQMMTTFVVYGYPSGVAPVGEPTVRGVGKSVREARAAAVAQEAGRPLVYYHVRSDGHLEHVAGDLSTITSARLRSARRWAGFERRRRR